MKRKLLISDLIGVAYSYDWDQVAAYVQEAFDLKDLLSGTEIKHIIRGADEGKSGLTRYQALSLGTMRLEENEFWIGALGSDYFAGIEPTDENIQKLRHSFEHLVGEMNWDYLQLVDDVRKQGYPTALLSNTTQPAVELNPYRQAVESVFDQHFYSQDIHVRKDNDAAYLLPYYAFNLNKTNDATLIDDKEENVKRAKLLGINSLLYSMLNEHQSVDAVRNFLARSGFKGLKKSYVDLGVRLRQVYEETVQNSVSP